MKHIEANLRIISMIAVGMATVFFRDQTIPFYIDTLCILASGYIVFLLIKKSLFLLFENKAWQFIMETFELCLAGLLVLVLPAEIRLLVLLLFVLRTASLSTAGQTAVITSCAILIYLLSAVLNEQWLPNDMASISYGIIAMLTLGGPAYVVVRLVLIGRRSQHHLDDAKNLLVVKERLVEELELSREKIREHAEKVSQLARRDSLTELYNRQYFNEYLEYCIDYLNENESCISIIDVYLSNVAVFSEDSEFGGSEKVLRALGKVIREHLDGDEVAARYVGNEFIICLPKKNAAEAEVVAKQIKEHFEKPRLNHPDEWLLQVDYGVSEIENENDKAVRIIQRARIDRKNRGRG